MGLVALSLSLSVGGWVGGWVGMKNEKWHVLCSCSPWRGPPAFSCNGVVGGGSGVVVVKVVVVWWVDGHISVCVYANGSEPSKHRPLS
jgi:hypothetical protein